MSAAIEVKAAILGRARPGGSAATTGAARSTSRIGSDDSARDSRGADVFSAVFGEAVEAAKPRTRAAEPVGEVPARSTARGRGKRNGAAAGSSRSPEGEDTTVEAQGPRVRRGRKDAASAGAGEASRPAGDGRREAAAGPLGPAGPEDLDEVAGSDGSDGIVGSDGADGDELGVGAPAGDAAAGDPAELEPEAAPMGGSDPVGDGTVDAADPFLVGSAAGPFSSPVADGAGIAEEVSTPGSAADDSLPVPGLVADDAEAGLVPPGDDAAAGPEDLTLETPVGSPADGGGETGSDGDPSESWKAPADGPANGSRPARKPGDSVGKNEASLAALQSLASPASMLREQVLAAPPETATAAAPPQDPAAGAAGAPGGTSTAGENPPVRSSPETLDLGQRRERWAAGLAAAIRSQVRSGSSQLRMVLRPPRLGQVEMQITLRGSALRIGIEVETNSVRHILGEGIGDLRTSLRDAGLELEKLRIEVNGREGRSGGRQEAGGEADGGRRQDRQPAVEGVGAAGGTEAAGGAELDAAAAAGISELAAAVVDVHA